MTGGGAWSLGVSQNPRGDWFLDVTAPADENGVASGCSFALAAFVPTLTDEQIEDLLGVVVEEGLRRGFPSYWWE